MLGAKSALCENGRFRLGLGFLFIGLKKNVNMGVGCRAQGNFNERRIGFRLLFLEVEEHFRGKKQ